MSFPLGIGAGVSPISTSLASREGGSSTLAPSVVTSTQLPDIHLAAFPFPTDVTSEEPDDRMGGESLVSPTDVAPPSPTDVAPLSGAPSNASVLDSLLGGTFSPALMPSSLPTPDGFTMRLRMMSLPIGSVPMVSVYREANGDLETALHVEVMILIFC